MLQLFELLSTELLETQESALRAAICGHIAYVLEAIKNALELPLPEIRIQQLTSKQEISAGVCIPDIDSQAIHSYCTSLIKAIQSHALTADVEQNLAELLNVLLSQFLEDVIASRFILDGGNLKMLGSEEMIKTYNQPQSHSAIHRCYV